MIQLDGVQRHFTVGGELVRALDGVDLDLADGEYVSIMGPSGSGKSTLLHVLGLLDRPTSGVYRIDGRDVTALDDEVRTRVRAEKIGFVFQFFHLVPRLTAAENVELPLTLAGVPPPQRRERVMQVLEAVGLTGRARHLPGQLSAGQRQRTAIARATVTSPSLLLADEPTGNLDRRTGSDVIDLLERLNTGGITLVVVTHDPEIGGRAGRHIRLVDGRVAADDGVRAAS
ncbi:ABC transporter ATP-binding protein [Arhodomonas sp. AD133]|uniref:ABC transporter ATP-binding protein n=1 Tax=Arhodomonas sp. AD133 TaxID=3415009 RepID=UPI003EBB7D6F